MLVSSTVYAVDPQYSITPLHKRTGANFFKIAGRLNDEGQFLISRRGQAGLAYDVLSANAQILNNNVLANSRHAHAFHFNNLGEYIYQKTDYQLGRHSGQSRYSVSNYFSENERILTPIQQSQSNFILSSFNNIGQFIGTDTQENGEERVLVMGTKNNANWIISNINVPLKLGNDTVGHPILLNNSNQIIGLSKPTASSDEAHAYVISKTGTEWAQEPLGSLGGNSTLPKDINNLGKITGTSTLRDGVTQHAFIASKTNNTWSMTDLGTLGGSSSTAIEINDAGQVIGTSQTRNEARSIPALFSDGQVYKLADLVTEGLDGWTEIISVNSINNKGQIIGIGKRGEDEYAYILNPINTASPICEVGLDPQTITAGEGTALWWWSDAVISASINNGIGNITVPSDYKWIYPRNSTLFTMTAKGADGSSIKCETTLIVEPDNPRPEPPICEIGADPQVIRAGEGSALWWWSDNVASATIDNGIGSVSVPSDYTWFYPTQTATYTMTTQGDDGTTSTCNTTITIQ